MSLDLKAQLEKPFQLLFGFIEASPGGTVLYYSDLDTEEGNSQV